MKFSFRFAPLLLILTVAAACGPGENVSTPRIRLVVPGGNPGEALFVVEGLSAADLNALRARTWSSDEWAALFHVSVASTGATDNPNVVPPMAGLYSVTADAIQFKPALGIEAGTRYRAALNLAQLPSSSALVPTGHELVEFLELPKAAQNRSTTVDHVFPTAAVVPENQLRFYIHFSGPMGLKGGLEYIRLLDDRNEEVKDPFLPLDADFWNADHTRFTVFFDPGRVKRGVRPNEEMGRSLMEGRSYTLLVSRDWRDANGLPLAEDFRRPFRVGPPDEQPIDPKRWHITAPHAGTREPVDVAFPEPLDQGLLLRALAVTSATGGLVAGAIGIESGETRWFFTPRDPWQAGQYRLKILTILEDLAGNRIGRAFEVDDFERVDRRQEPEEMFLAFRIDN